MVRDRLLITGRGATKGKSTGPKLFVPPISMAKTSSYHVKITSKLVVPQGGGGLIRYRGLRSNCPTGMIVLRGNCPTRVIVLRRNCPTGAMS